MLRGETTDAAIVAELGARIATHRLARNLTQGQFADEAGVGRSTIQRVEGGDSIQLSSFIKILRALDRVEAVDALLSPEIRSPLAELERQRGRRQRARSTRARSAPGETQGETGASSASSGPSASSGSSASSAPSGPSEPSASEWTWGDE